MPGYNPAQNTSTIIMSGQYSIVLVAKAAFLERPTKGYLLSSQKSWICQTDIILALNILLPTGNLPFAKKDVEQIKERMKKVKRYT